MKRVGILVGREKTFPDALINSINQRGQGETVAEFIKLGGVRHDAPPQYDLVIDRISHEVPFYRATLKRMALEGTIIINNPFWWSADDKFFNYSLARKLGVAVPKTVLLPQKDYKEGVVSESLRNLKYPIDWEGIIEHVGPGVTEFKVGDEVFGMVGWLEGAHAEYVCLRESGSIAHKPTNLSFEEAASICDGAMQALATLRVGEVREGSRIAIYGASGSLGTAAVQLGKHFRAHVTGVTSTRNVELVRSLGADDVIDYTREDLAKRGPVFDVVIDAVGKYAFHWGRRALKRAAKTLAEWSGRIVFLNFSDDGSHVAAVLQQQDRFVAIVDGRSGQEYVEIGTGMPFFIAKGFMLTPIREDSWFPIAQNLL